MYHSAYYDPALAYSQYGKDPTAYTQYAYGQTQFDQTSYGQATPAFQSTTWAAPETKGESSGKPAVFMMCAMFIFLSATVTLAVYAVWGTTPDGSTTTEDDSAGHGSYPPVFYDGRVEVRVTSTPTPGTTYASTNVPPLSVGQQILICTYTGRTTSDAVMASDGLCDIAYYDSIYAYNKNFLYGGRPFEIDLVTFMRAAKRYTRTTLGVAFSFQHMDQLGKDLRRVNPGPLEVFWHNGIYHTGVLNTPTRATRDQMKTAMYRLKDLDALASSQRVLGHRPVTALATPSPGRDWMYLIDEESRRLQFVPDYIVAYGHYPFGDNTQNKCAVMPPTRFTTVPLPLQFRTSYLYDMSVGPQGIRVLDLRQVPTHGLLSVTMKGRWTTASQGQPFEFFSSCELRPRARSFGRYAEICKDRTYESNLRYQPLHYAVLTYDSANRSVFAYDNEEGLAAKLCKVKYQAREVTFGIAAYDVDFDDHANDCRSISKFGPHSRLKALRKIVDYYKGHPNASFSEASCTSVVL